MHITNEKKKKKKLLVFSNTSSLSAMTRLTASICWNILAHKTDEVGEVGVKIYQKPVSNDIYELRRKKNPPLCKENENPDAAWYAKMSLFCHSSSYLVLLI